MALFMDGALRLRLEVSTVRGRDVAIIIGAIVLVVLLIGLLGGGMMMGWGMMGWGGYGFNPFGWVMMVVVWALIIGGIALLAIWLLREGAPSVSGVSSSARALDILKERYARGEITHEQYDQMRRDIEGP
jgi:putative membrane protein